MKQTVNRNIYVVTQNNNVIAVATSKARAEQIKAEKANKCWKLFNRFKIQRFNNEDLNK